MRKLIVRPESPMSGFIRAAIATGVAVDIPLTISLLVGVGVAGLIWSLLFTTVCAVIAGAAVAVLRLIQAWAYERYTGTPSH